MVRGQAGTRDQLIAEKLEALRVAAERVPDKGLHVHYMGTDAGDNHIWGVYTPLDYRMIARCGGPNSQGMARFIVAARQLAEVLEKSDGNV